MVVQCRDLQTAAYLSCAMKTKSSISVPPSKWRRKIQQRECSCVFFFSFSKFTIILTAAKEARVISTKERGSQEESMRCSGLGGKKLWPQWECYLKLAAWTTRKSIERRDSTSWLMISPAKWILTLQTDLTILWTPLCGLFWADL